MLSTIKSTDGKGQRTPRTTDVYQEKNGVRGAVYCSCGAVFRNKRWYTGDRGAKPQGGQGHVCPACRRIADRNPAGIVSLSGSYFAAHAIEIDNLIKNTAQSVVAKNPLGRIMDINREGESTIITTTDVKLAQKIGRDVFKSHGGELHFKWSNAEDFVRVILNRQLQ